MQKICFNQFNKVAFFLNKHRTHCPPNHLTTASQTSIRDSFEKRETRSLTPIDKILKLERRIGKDVISEPREHKRVMSSKLHGNLTRDVMLWSSKKKEHKEERKENQLKLVLLQQNHIRSVSAPKQRSGTLVPSFSNVSYISGKKIVVKNGK